MGIAEPIAISTMIIAKIFAISLPPLAGILSAYCQIAAGSTAAIR
jgi:hypothetical protein